MKPRRDELVQLGENALEQLRGPVLTEFRRRLGRWRDPRARLIRRRRVAKGGAVGGAATAGVFGAGSYVSASSASLWEAAELGAFTAAAQDIATFGLGGVAVAGAIGAVGAGVRYLSLRRTPLPDPPPEPVALPPSGSAAREPMQRLRDAERTLHGAVEQLASVDSGSTAADAKGTADAAAAELRAVAARLQSVEGALEHAPDTERTELRDAIQRMRDELDEGVAEYGRLVAAAGRAVAASGAPEQRTLLQDATDRLAGLAEGLRELFGPGGPAAPPGSRR
ncbi:phage shock envelope stress response protein PspM [Saccharopolyspora cebuensis]|uniref:Uncharacterized protein n=1 Tax=Saccharopolyspora cebuensis TaxID=418759 RepID=A0ABV4CLC0_9PSEU